MRCHGRFTVSLALMAMATAACGDDEPKTTRRGRQSTADIRPGMPSVEAREKAQAGAFYATPQLTMPEGLEAGELIVHKITEDSFIESPARRDPFRSFIIPLTKKSEMSSLPQVEAILTQYQIDELLLIAIISGTGTESGAPMAMVVDPTGLGHIIRRGNYVGRGETVRKVHSGEEVFIYWRVARIRDDAVVFEREDPFSPTEATVTKILSLEAEKD